MPLLENTLFGPQDRVATAINRLQTFARSDGYYLAFSGGKDSQTIYHLAKEAGVTFEAHYHPTTIDPPELIRFIKTNYPDVIFDKPKRSMWEAILANAWPPTRQARYCCKEFKETQTDARITITGIRWQESPRRRQRHLTETCYRNTTNTLLHPIIDWTTEHVWEYLNTRALPHCTLYDEGFHRIGCVLCPMTRTTDQHIARWPNIAAHFIATFDKLVRQRKSQGKRCTFNTGSELFAFWTARDQASTPDEQLTLFD